MLRGAFILITDITIAFNINLEIYEVYLYNFFVCAMRRRAGRCSYVIKTDTCRFGTGFNSHIACDAFVFCLYGCEKRVHPGGPVLSDRDTNGDIYFHLVHGSD